MSLGINVYIKKQIVNDLNEKVIQYFKENSLYIELHPKFSLFESKGRQPLKLNKGSSILGYTLEDDVLCAFQIFVTDLTQEEFEHIPLENADYMVQIIAHSSSDIDIAISTIFASFITKLFSGTLEDLIECQTTDYLGVDEYLQPMLISYRSDLVKALQNKNYQIFTNWYDEWAQINIPTCDLFSEKDGKIIEFVMAKNKNYTQPYKIMPPVRINALFRKFLNSCKSISIICPNYDGNNNKIGRKCQEIEVARKIPGFSCHNMKYAVERLKQDIETGVISKSEFNEKQLRDIEAGNTYIDGFVWHEDDECYMDLAIETSHRKELHENLCDIMGYSIEQKLITKNYFKEGALTKFFNKIKTPYKVLKNAFSSKDNHLKNSRFEVLYDNGKIRLEKISELEQKLCYQFPITYKEFISQHNGARLKNNMFRYHNSYSNSEEINFITFCDVEDIYPILEDLRSLENNEGKGVFSDYLIAFGVNGRGDYICFDYGNMYNNEPSIVCWKHDVCNNGERISFAAESFNDFIKILVSDYDSLQ